ncbi:MAG: histidinol-phosphate aminotransferase [Thermotogota bacterium]|nr:histidinol-phosphate aminotransferase [Thermotogota bacterium]MDK2864315.1 histidinol-phosphate aminotransferase [Thermotogota bacterium]HCZ06351.1 histidinol-phosphate transaminase [Thermotogota bacterium]
MRFNERLEKFKPYTTIEGDYRIWLNRNESPYDLPKSLKEEILEEFRKLPFNRYPHITADPLRERIASFLGLDISNVVVGNGTDGLMPYLIKIFDGGHVVVSSPTFPMYKFYAELEGVPVVDVPLGDDFSLGDLEKAARGARLVFICSPNNPTGNVFERERIVKVLETGVPVVLDEAYVEFSEHGSNIDLIYDFDNLIVLRTFSKAFGLAGIRVGYAVAHESVVDHVLRIMSPFSMNLLSMKIAEKLLEHQDLVEENVRTIVSERERIFQELREYAYPSQTNFLLIRLDIFDFLLEKGIVVRKLDGKLKGMVRVTVGKRWENDEFLSAVRDFLGDL